MKYKGQGKKEFIVRLYGRVSGLLTINQAARIVIDYELRGIKAELLHYNEFLGA